MKCIQLSSGCRNDYHDQNNEDRSNPTTIHGCTSLLKMTGKCRYDPPAQSPPRGCRPQCWSPGTTSESPFQLRWQVSISPLGYCQLDQLQSRFGVVNRRNPISAGTGNLIPNLEGGGSKNPKVKLAIAGVLPVAGIRWARSKCGSNLSLADTEPNKARHYQGRLQIL
jgi:hypothetical protein